MAQNNRRKRNTFRKFENLMTKVILGITVLFLLLLTASAIGIGWLKWLLAITILVVSAMGTALLVLKQEHRRRRSLWMLASFVGFLACTLVSLIAGYPAP